MKLDIVKYNDALRTSWDDFLINSINGTFLHSRAFFDHNALNKHDDHSFLFYKKNKVAAVIPFALYEKEGVRVLNSHLRATYGGFVVNNEIGTEEALEMVDKIIEVGKAADVREIIIRNPFRILNSRLCDETDYAMWNRGFKIKFRELEVAIKLQDKGAVEKLYEDATKRSINKGKKILIVEESDDYMTYWDIVTANLESKHGARPTHNLEQFMILLSKVGAEKIKLFVARLDGKIIGGIVVFIVNEMCLHAQYIASDLSNQEHRPLNVIVDFIISWGYDHGFKYFNLGMANDDNGRRINSGLFRFKEGFGGRGTLRETMSLILSR